VCAYRGGREGGRPLDFVPDLLSRSINLDTKLGGGKREPGMRAGCTISEHTPLREDIRVGR